MIARNRLMAGAALLVLLGILVGVGVGRLLFGGNGVPSTYAGVVEQPGDPSFPSAAPGPGSGRQTVAFSNTGRNIQQLALSVTSEGTLAIHSASAYMRMSDAPGKIDYGQGPVYTPERQTQPESLGHSRGPLTWNLGDLPAGYLMVVTLHVTRLKPLPRHGYILNSNWDALTSPDQPRRDWKQITGEIAAFG